MTAARLFSILVDLGVKLWTTADNKLCWEAIKGVVTKELQDKISTYKTDLLSIIRTSQNKYLSQHIGRIIHDDCLHALRKIPEESVDLVCTDPPYGLEFMNKVWDKSVPPLEIWQEVYRVLMPGAFALVMCSPRQDSLGSMISVLAEAGFVTKFTSIYWTYATGFPKAQSVSKLIDKRAGAAREVVGTATYPASFFSETEIPQGEPDRKNEVEAPITTPSTEIAILLDGATPGFQPKPAVEIVLVVMKPLTEKTYTDQAIENQKGITWPNKCRIPYPKGEPISERNLKRQKSYSSGQVPASKGDIFIGHDKGRVSANLLISDDILNNGSDLIEGYSRYFSLDSWFFEMFKDLPEDIQGTFPFLISPKASVAEKNNGLEDFDHKPVNDGRKTSANNAYQRGDKMRLNTHPTVKPIKLLSFLITMFSRPGDLIADMFVGSGSTCVAAKMLDRRFIGIEKEEEYCRIAEGRLAVVPDPLTKRQPSAGKDKKMKNPSYGFKEWAVKSVNFSTGCVNNCRYCYAKGMAVRFKQVEHDDWSKPHIRQHDVDKKHKNYGETVMFPSSHDLTPDNLEACLIVLGKLLRAGNKVLIVSKPHLDVIRAICEKFGEYRKNILFRFTITATDDNILSFWEPGAPKYEERLDALACAFDEGFETSVSVEPMLDADNIDHLVADLMPRVSHSIWIGKMNHMGRINIDGPEVEQALERIKAGQTNDRILAMYLRHKDNPAIRWKGSIKDIVGIKRPDKPGMDI